MNYFKLAYTTPDVLVKIKEAEKRGDFNAHLDPVAAFRSMKNFLIFRRGL